MNLTCPICHATLSLEAIAQDDAARELIVLIGKQPEAVRPHLLAYLGLFRSAKRSLSWSRSVKLLNEVLELGITPPALAVALTETVETMRQKREMGDVRPLKNHNYLKRVLESVGTTPETALQIPSTRTGLNRYAGAMADSILREWAGDDWLRIEIMHGLLALLAKPLYLKPAVQDIEKTASLWEMELRKGRIVLVESIDRPRINAGFKELIGAKMDKFPQPADIRDHLPWRPQQIKIEAPIDEGNIADGRQMLRDFVEGKDS